MTNYTTVTLDREIACSPDRLFHIMTDRELRQKWLAPDDESVIIIDEFHCRSGGREATYSGSKDAPDFNTTSLFHVVTPEFISLTEILVIGGEMMSISLCGHEISKSDKGSQLRVILQITSLVGPELFAEVQNGWDAALEKLAGLASAMNQS